MAITESDRNYLLPKAKQAEVKRTASLPQILQMLAPAGALLAALILHLTLPNVYPKGYQSVTYPAFLKTCLGIYMIFGLAAFLLPKLRAKMLYLSWLLTAAVLLVAALDMATLKTGHFRLPFVPSPDKILSSVTSNLETLAVSLYFSMKLLFTGIVIGIISGMISGILLGWSQICNYWFMPVLKMIGPVPSAAWLPIVMVLFATSRQASVFLIVLSIWFPLTLMVSSAIRDTDKRLVETARVLGAGEVYIMLHVALPAALPAMFTGLFMGLSSSFGALIIAEMLGVEAGLGWYIKWAEAWGEYAKIFSTVGIFIIIFFILMDTLFRLRNRLLKWQKGTVRW